MIQSILTSNQVTFRKNLVTSETDITHISRVHPRKRLKKTYLFEILQAYPALSNVHNQCSQSATEGRSISSTGKQIRGYNDSGEREETAPGD